jgi:hypothetical protein
MWHCPHCGAPQAETARCWVCRRSSTTCSTCTHFRRALAGDLGYCGLDARRRPLTGLEQRGCWAPKAAAGEPASPRPTLVEEPHRLRGGRRPTTPTFGTDTTRALRDFVPVETLTVRRATESKAERAEPEPTPVAVPAEPEPTPVAVEHGADEHGAERPPARNAPPAFVIEPDPAWNERTSLFGEPDG